MIAAIPYASATWILLALVLLFVNVRKRRLGGSPPPMPELCEKCHAKPIDAEYWCAECLCEKCGEKAKAEGDEYCSDCAHDAEADSDCQCSRCAEAMAGWGDYMEDR